MAIPAEVGSLSSESLSAEAEAESESGSSTSEPFAAPGPPGPPAAAARRRTSRSENPAASSAAAKPARASGTSDTLAQHEMKARQEERSPPPRRVYMRCSQRVAPARAPAACIWRVADPRVARLWRRKPMRRTEAREAWSGWRAWCRRARAMLVWPDSRRRLMSRLRQTARTWGPEPVLAW